MTKNAYVRTGYGTQPSHMLLQMENICKLHTLRVRFIRFIRFIMHSVMIWAVVVVFSVVFASCYSAECVLRFSFNYHTGDADETDRHSTCMHTLKFSLWCRSHDRAIHMAESNKKTARRTVSRRSVRVVVLCMQKIILGSRAARQTSAALSATVEKQNNQWSG